MEWHKNWKSIVPAAACGFAFTTTMPMASAFFPPVSEPTQTVTVVPVSPAPVIVPPAIPPVPPPPVVVPPVPPHCGCGGDPVVKPQSVPEPGTLVAVGSGLVTLLGYGLRKRGSERRN